MDDFAHKETDRILEDLERKIKKIYEQASRDMRKKADVYFARLAERDKKQKARMEAGEITEEQYRQWRLAQIGRGRRIEKLSEELADRMLNANEVAAAYINDTTPGIYSLNHNYEAYTIEKLGGDIGFTIYDERTVRRMIEDDPDLLPRRRVDAPVDKKWNRERFLAEITSGILQGESIGKLANRVENLSDANRAGAIRNARTAVTGAENAGRQESYTKAKEMGIDVRKRWIAIKDMRTRHEHAKLDGQTVPVDEPFVVDGHKLMYPGDPTGLPRLIWNCRCSMRTVEKEGIEAEPRQMRVRNPEWDEARAEETRLEEKVERLKNKEKAESDPDKREQLRKERLEAQKQLEKQRKKRQSIDKNVVVQEMTYFEWLEWVKSRG